MTRNEICNIIHQYAMDYMRYKHDLWELELTDPTNEIKPKPPINPCSLIFNSSEQQLCENCKYDSYGCSVQDSILQVNPEAIFTTFGCNGFESCK